MVARRHLLFDLFLLICLDAMLLAYYQSLTSIREIYNGYIFMRALLLLALAISPDTCVKLSTF